MKTAKKLAGIIAVVAIIGFTMAACDDGNTGGNINVDTALNGTWSSTQEGRPLEYFFNNGSFEVAIDDAPYGKGTYTTSGNTLATNVSHVYGYNAFTEMLRIELQAKWYTLTEFYDAVKAAFGLSDEGWAVIESIFEEQFQTVAIHTYSVSGNTLTLTTDVNQFGETETQTFIRK